MTIKMYPEIGSIRIRRAFLFFPKTMIIYDEFYRVIGKDTRWLTTQSWRQYHVGQGWWRDSRDLWVDNLESEKKHDQC